MSKYSKGDKVKYKPTGEVGEVTSTNDCFVFVRFTIEGDTSQACRREDLEKLT